MNDRQDFSTITDADATFEESGDASFEESGDAVSEQDTEAAAESNFQSAEPDFQSADEGCPSRDGSFANADGTEFTPSNAAEFTCQNAAENPDARAANMPETCEIGDFSPNPPPQNIPPAPAWNAYSQPAPVPPAYARQPYPQTPQTPAYYAPRGAAQPNAQPVNMQPYAWPAYVRPPYSQPTQAPAQKPKEPPTAKKMRLALNLSLVGLILSVFCGLGIFFGVAGLVLGALWGGTRYQATSMAIKLGITAIVLSAAFGLLGAWVIVSAVIAAL